jgi:DNA-binding transcriptional regulator/RsmH inhibitor MraZ
MLVAGEKGRPWLYPNLYHDEISQDLTADIAPDIDDTEADRLLYGFTYLLQTDAQGRVLIPSEVMGWPGMGKQSKYYLVCVRDHVEVWDVPSWEFERRDLLGRRNEVIQKARLRRAANAEVKAKLDLPPPQTPDGSEN